MPTKQYIIQGRDGAIGLYFDSLWDGNEPIVNVDDWVEFNYNISKPNDEEFTRTDTTSPFKLIQRAVEENTWKLCGYVKPEGSSHNAFVFIGTYTALSQGGETICYNGGGFNFNGTITHNNVNYPYDGTGTTEYYFTIPMHFSMYGGTDNAMHLDMNFPIFDSYAHLEAYILNGSLEGCYNANDEYIFDTTKYYFIYNNQTSGKLLNGQIAPVSGATYTWHSLKFAANEKPVLYFDDAFGLTLKASSIVASKAVNGPGYVIDNIPEEGWTEGRLEYSGPFYGTLPARIAATGSIPANGTYNYGYECNTNIYIFKNETDADTAISTGDYSQASNYYDLETGNTHQPIVIGNEETATTFGDGYATNPFVSSYICSRNDVLNVANAFYSNDTTLIDNIKKGLELFGANPYECICGLSWQPFDINTIATAQPQSWIYFGSYKHEPAGLSIDKIVNMNANGYVDAGSVYIAPLFSSYRDLPPFCTLSCYLPYSGWHEIDIAKYYKKTVNVRYYVDIYTNTFACALVVDNQICDIFNGNIGVTLPICGSNLSEYANSMLRAVLSTVGGTAGGAISGAMIGGGVPGAVIGATVGGFAGIAKGTFEMSQKGQPKDHLQVKGAFSGASSSYMPQYVIFRYDVHDLIVPDNLTQLYGRPSSASGKIGSFSGFLKCDTVKLNTGRMTDAEINETLALLRQGIYV